jgi:hypothetical protein
MRQMLTFATAVKQNQALGDNTVGVCCYVPGRKK